MEKILELLMDGESLGPTELRKILQLTPEELDQEMERLKKERVLLGWRPILHPDTWEAHKVRAVIEVRISPERGGGFDRLANRIAQFEEVESCYLMSGGYDLLLMANGKSLHQIARFVSERLSTIQGVLSTATHFMLRAYKEQGFLLPTREEQSDRPTVSP
jgi:DNA-binding Lrp family transcriptional regulator